MKKFYQLSCIAMAIVFLGCAARGSLIKPEISVVNMSLEQASLLETRALFEVRIQNENDFPVEIERSVHSLEINGVRLGKGLDPEGFIVPAFSSIKIPIEINLSNVTILTKLSDLVDNDSINYRISSVLYPSSGGRKVEVSEEGDFDY